jgi:hypothetical protein
MRSDTDGDPGDLLIGMVDDAVHVGATLLGVVDAEMDLADADVENDDLARFIGGQRQRVGVVGMNNGVGLGGDQIDRHGAGAIGQQA